MSSPAPSVPTTTLLPTKSAASWGCQKKSSNNSSLPKNNRGERKGPLCSPTTATEGRGKQGGLFRSLRAVKESRRERRRSFHAPAAIPEGDGEQGSLFHSPTATQVGRGERRAPHCSPWAEKIIIEMIVLRRSSQPVELRIFTKNRVRKNTHTISCKSLKSAT